MREPSPWDMPVSSRVEEAENLHKRKRTSDMLPDEVPVSSATVKKRRNSPVKSTRRPSSAGPSPSSTPPREQPSRLVSTGRTDRGVESGSSRSKPAEETVVDEILPIVHYIPPETRLESDHTNLVVF